MPHHNSVFHTMLKLVPWDELDRAVERHGNSAGARSFSHKSHLAAMLYAQLSGAASLRDVEAGLHSHADRLYHLGVSPAARSTLADANRDRPAAVFADLLAAMMRCAHPGLRRKMGKMTRLIDSTSLRLNRHSAGWARFSQASCGAKLHVMYDPAADAPLRATVTPARVNDITPAKAWPVEPGSTQVMDLGYYDFGWWARIGAAGSHFVTRLKANTPLTITETRPVPGSGPILSDTVGTLPKRQARNRRNPLGKPVRVVEVRINTGKILRLVTNNLQAPAQEVADLYKQRWAIELFFRWIKQTLTITRFLGTTENAVHLQVATALIAFLLLRMAQRLQAAITSPLEFARLIRTTLMHRRPLHDLKHPAKPTPLDSRQTALFPT